MIKNEWPRDFVVINFSDKRKELESILNDIHLGDKNRFIDDLENELRYIEFLFASIRHRPGKISKKDYHSRDKLLNETRRAIKCVEGLLAYKNEYSQSMIRAYIDAFNSLYTEEQIDPLINILLSRYTEEQINPTIYQLLNRFPLFDYCLKQSLIKELRILEKVENILAEPNFKPKPKIRDHYLELFILIGGRFITILHVMPTSTYHNDVKSYGTYARVIMWVFEVFEEQLPRSMENLLKETVSALRLVWDNINTNSSGIIPTQFP